MRVGIDFNAAFTTQAGVARYLAGLVGGLNKISDSGVEVEKIAWEVENFEYQQPARALKTLYRELVWAKTIAPLKLRSLGPDIFHSTSGVLVVPPSHIPHVVTVHDLAVLKQKGRFRRWHRYSSTARLQHLPKADKVICISRSTADECMSLLNIPASKIEVIYNGCDFHPDLSPPSETKPKIEIPDQFFLFVGSLEPGKNLSLLAKVYRKAKVDRRNLPPLFIVGARWEGVDREDRPPANWHYLGRIPDENLVYLYRRALCLIFPSKYEGFGLPIAEAMALSCPVICSRVSSLPEVGGDAAFYSEMTPDNYLHAMTEITNNEQLRKELKVKGLAQASKFKWEKCAREVIEVYNAVFNK